MIWLVLILYLCSSLMTFGILFAVNELRFDRNFAPVWVMTVGAICWPICIILFGYFFIRNMRER